MQAPSGAWVNPAFCLHQSKLDKWQPRAAPAQQASSRAEARQRCRTAWYTHVIFDCDGVLVDSERASCEALRRSVLEVTGACAATCCFRAVLASALVVPGGVRGLPWCRWVAITYKMMRACTASGPCESSA